MLPYGAPCIGAVSLFVTVFVAAPTTAAQEVRPPFWARSGMSGEEAREVQRAAAEHFDLDLTLRVEIDDAVHIDFVLIPPGDFLMGAPGTPEETAERWPGPASGHLVHEHPQHRVTITSPFYAGAFEVTRLQWHALMGGRPPTPETRDLPVEHITWDAAQDFTRRLSERVGLEVRFLTEAQWEFAARAGTTTAFSFGDAFSTELANCEGERALPVGGFPPNAWGLYDVHGNVVEWVNDAYGFYSAEDQIDPTGPEHIGRMLRGGAYDGRPRNCRSAFRYAHAPWMGDQVSGLRVAVVVESPTSLVPQSRHGVHLRGAEGG